MDNIDEKLEKFSKVVMQDATVKKDAILTQIEATKHAVLEQKELEYLQEAYAFIQNEKRKIFKANSDKLSKAIMESKRKLFTKREEIVNAVFERIHQRITEFLQTDDYKNLLFKLVEDSIKRTGEGKKLILIDEADKRFIDELTQHFESLGAQFEISENPFIGGCITRNDSQNIVVDETILDRINEQKHLFIEFSGLTIE